MTESQSLPVNFGGIAEEEFSSFDPARILIWPVSYEGTVSYGTGTGRGAEAIIEASRNMELYDEETDAEVYKLGLHTLDPSPSIEPAETPHFERNVRVGVKRMLISSRPSRPGPVRCRDARFAPQEPSRDARQLLPPRRHAGRHRQQWFPHS